MRKHFLQRAVALEDNGDPKVYGVDLDGTLALWDGEWRGFDHIGEPIQAMVDTVKNWIAEGIEVVIFTARASDQEEPRDVVCGPIEEWCLKHIGKKLEVTCIKDRRITRYFDDLAVRVERNKGIICCMKET